MSRVRNRNTKPEQQVRSLLHKLGYRFRLHRRELPGSPDIVLPKHKRVIFVHGCFWHQHPGCSRATRPATNMEFWNNKLFQNMKRDEQALSALANLGWQSLVVWTCEVKRKEQLQEKLAAFLPKE